MFILRRSKFKVLSLYPEYNRALDGIKGYLRGDVRVCASYRERTEKQRMYSVSHGLNSG